MITRFLLAGVFIAAGLLHFIAPGRFRGIVPAYLPVPNLLVAVSGIAELLGGVGLLVPWTRLAASWGLVLLLLSVFPANIEMLRQARATHVVWWGEVLLWLRLPLQGVLIWLVLRAGRR